MICKTRNGKSVVLTTVESEFPTTIDDVFEFPKVLNISGDRTPFVRFSIKFSGVRTLRTGCRLTRIVPERHKLPRTSTLKVEGLETLGFHNERVDDWMSYGTGRIAHFDVC